MPSEKTQLEVFQEAVDEYMKLFGLTSWEWFVAESTLQDRAQVHYCMDSRIATFVYNDNPRESTNPRKEAFHEVMEVFLSELGQFTFNDSIPKEEALRRGDEEFHRIIRTLENVVFPELEKVLGYLGGL